MPAPDSLPLVAPPCPACRADGTAPRFVVARDDIEAGLRYPVYRCAACGHTWATGRADLALMRRLFGPAFYQSSQQSAIAADAPVVLNARARVADLTARGLRGRLLDIGAGAGYFVAAATGSFAADGLELSEAAVAQARARGVNLHCGALEDMDARGGYDVVTLWDVFAGFADPGATLDRLAGLLAPGGWLVMTMPDAGARIARWAGPRWPMMIPPVNMTYCTPASITHLLTSHGFTAPELRHDGKLVSVDFAVRKLLRAMGWAGAATVTLPLPRGLRLRLNLGDIMTVVARRRAA